MGKHGNSEPQGGGKSKRAKAKYIESAKKSWSNSLIPVGSEGFLVTCIGGKEGPSAREATLILDEAWETLVEQKYPGVLGGASAGGAQPGGGPVKDEKPDSIDALLESELSSIRSKDQERFTRVETGCKGILYLRLNRAVDEERKKVGPAPSEIAALVVRTAFETKKANCRYCLRFLPMEVTCHASIKEISKAVPALINRYFPTLEESPSLKYAIVYESRASSGLDRMETIKAIAELVPKKHTVNLTQPDLYILVQVVKSTCGLSVITNFKEWAKYNLRELSTVKETEGGPGDAAEEHETNGGGDEAEKSSEEEKGDGTEGGNGAEGRKDVTESKETVGKLEDVAANGAKVVIDATVEECQVAKGLEQTVSAPDS